MLLPYYCHALPSDSAQWDDHFKRCQLEAIDQFKSDIRRFDGRLQIHMALSVYERVNGVCRSLKLQPYPTLQGMEIWLLEGLETPIVTPLVAPLVYVNDEEALNQAIIEKVMLFQKGRYTLDRIEAQKLIAFLRKFHAVISLSYGQTLVTATIVGNHLNAAPVCASHESDLTALGIAALLNESQRTQRFLPLVGRGLESVPPYCLL